MDKLAFNTTEVGELLGISRGKVNELVLGGQIRSIKVGSRRIIPRAAIAEFLGDPSLVQGVAKDVSSGPARADPPKPSLGIEGKYVVTIARVADDGSRPWSNSRR